MAVSIQKTYQKQTPQRELMWMVGLRMCQHVTSNLLLSSWHSVNMYD